MHDNDAFVTDGIIDNEKWNSTHPKMMFLLKESTKRSGWTKIAGVPINTREGDNPRFWPNVLRWKHAVSTAVTECRVPEYPSMDDTKEYRENNGFLDDIAYVNVNKKLGETKSSDVAITKIAFENRATLEKQIDLINPSVVFCCYTFEAYQTIYGESAIKEVARKIYLHGNRIVISFYHPANRRGPKDLYDDLSLMLKQEAFINQFTAPATSSP